MQLIAWRPAGPCSPPAGAAFTLEGLVTVDIGNAIEMLGRLERMVLELEQTAGVRVVVEVKLETSVRLEDLARRVEVSGP